MDLVRRFEQLASNSQYDVRLIINNETGEIRLCDDSGYYGGTDVKDLEPSQVRGLFPDYEDLKATDYNY